MWPRCETNCRLLSITVTTGREFNVRRESYHAKHTDAFNRRRVWARKPVDVDIVKSEPS